MPVTLCYLYWTNYGWQKRNCGHPLRRVYSSRHPVEKEKFDSKTQEKLLYFILNRPKQQGSIFFCSCWNGLSFKCKRSMITGSHGRTLYQLQHRPTLALSAIFWRALHEASHCLHFWSLIFLWEVWVFSLGLSACEVCLITPSNCMIPFTFLCNLWFSRAQHALTSQASASAMAVVLVKTNEEKLGVEGTRRA